MKIKLKCLAAMALSVCMLAAVMTGCEEQTEEPEGLNIHFFQFDETDKKWGDCTLFTFPDGSNMLVDCGMKLVGEYLVNDLKAMGVETIDVLVLSHFHSDHIGSFQAIVDNFDVKQVYSPGFVPAECEWIEAEIERLEMPYEYLHAGDAFTIGGVEAKVLWPTADLAAENPAAPWDDTNLVIDTNNRSMVFRLDYEETSVLMTGDIYKEGQRDLLDYYSDDPSILDADLLKIPHHGYQNAVNEEFINAVTPQYAVMQGNQIMNKVYYKKYTQAGCTTFAGWMNGDIDMFLWDGSVTVSAENPEIKEYYRSAM